MRGHRYIVITPFQRFENFNRLREHLEPLGVVWVPVFDEEWSGRLFFPEPWIQPMCCPAKVEGWFMGYYKINWALDRLEHRPGNRYCFLNDDDFFGAKFFEHIDTLDNQLLIVCDMERGHHAVGRHECSRLEASPANMKPGHVASEQLIFGPEPATVHRFGPSFEADGLLAQELAGRYFVTYTGQASVLFNYLEPGRWDSK